MLDVWHMELDDITELIGAFQNHDVQVIGDARNGVPMAFLLTTAAKTVNLSDLYALIRTTLGEK